MQNNTLNINKKEPLFSGSFFAGIEAQLLKKRQNFPSIRWIAMVVSLIRTSLMELFREPPDKPVSWSLKKRQNRSCSLVESPRRCSWKWKSLPSRSFPSLSKTFTSNLDVRGQNSATTPHSRMIFANFIMKIAPPSVIYYHYQGTT